MVVVIGELAGDIGVFTYEGLSPRMRGTRPAVYFVKSRWTLSALNLNTFGVQVERRRRLFPCFLLFVWLAYFMRECLFR